MGLSHSQPAANGHASGSSSVHYHHDSMQTSPVTAVGGSGQWDQGSQQLVTHGPGGHSRQNSGMVPNGAAAAGTSPQIAHAGAHPPRDQYPGHPHPAHNGSGPPGHDSASSSSSGPQQQQSGVHYSPTSDGTPPSYQINDTDKNWMEALLYPPPLTSEQNMQGMAMVASGQMGVGAEQNGGMAAPHHIQPSQPVQHGMQGYDVAHGQQQMTSQHPAHPSQQLPPHHQAPPHGHQMHHGVHHQVIPQHPHQGHNLYSGPLPAQQSTAMIGDYSQSGAYYLQEEFDQSVPIDGLAIPAQNGMWTS